MIKRVLCLTLLFCVSACQDNQNIDVSQLSAEEKKSLQALAWLKDSNVERDVQAALDKQDSRLLSMMGRTTELPGVPSELTSRAKSACGIRYVEGSTDVVQGEVHLKWLQQAYDYAAAYNQLIIKNCLEN
ncbi:MAG: glutamyl-tRNA amidotransferase [Candidatus Thiodiazotropha sp.]